MTVIFDAAPLRIQPCRHGVMMYLTNDLIGRSLDLYGEFAEQEMQIFEAFVPPGAVVVDAGANIGTHTLRLSELAGPAGLVLAFEPQRAVYNLLCGNLGLNKVRNVRAYHAALGEAAGQIETPPVDYGRPGHFNFGAIALGEPGAYPAGGEKVTLLPLDAFGLERCDLMKVDVEGMERAVLAGAAATIGRAQPVLYVENNRPEKSPQVLQWLLGAGYRCYWHVISYFSPGNFRGAAEDIFKGALEINVLAVPAARAGVVGGLQEAVSPDAWPEGIFVVGSKAAPP